jgi:hypothetical protein
MSGQYSLTSEQTTAIRNILNEHNIEMIAETSLCNTNKGTIEKTIFNEISIKISDEDGECWYIQVN